MILSSVSTSSVWNPVKRIFHGSPCDVGRYPWLSRHNQPSTTTGTTTRTTTNAPRLFGCFVSLHLLAPLSAFDPLPSLSFSLSPSSTTAPAQHLPQPQKPLCRSACLFPTNCLDDLECNLQEDRRRQDQDDISMDDKTQLFVDSCASTSPSLMTNSIRQTIWVLSNVLCNGVGFVSRSGCRP